MLTFFGVVAAASRSATASEEITTRLRIAWGGGAYTSWEGQISVDGGRLSDPQPLGIESDAPGSIWLGDDGTLHVERRGPRRYDGVDVTIMGDEKATLQMALASGESESPIGVQFPVAHLRTTAERTGLDEQGNYLLIHRAPGDSLRVTSDRDVLIFEPSETVSLGLTVDLPESQAPEEVELHVSVRHARTGQTTWSNQLPVPAAEARASAIDLEIPLPESEGVYNIHLTAHASEGLVPRWVPGAGDRALAHRQVQVVVFDASRFAATPIGKWQTIAEIDPTNPAWWHRLPKWMRVDRLPGFSKVVLTNTDTAIRELPQGRFLELPSGKGRQEPAWFALSVPVETPHIPHLLEIELAGDIPIDVGISLLEPNAAGKVVPIARDFGVHHQPSPWQDDGAPLTTYRFVYWPRTTAPLLLCTNQHEGVPARVGRIRVSSRRGGLARESKQVFSIRPRRLAAGYFAKPLLPEAFGVTDVRDPQTGQTFDDWQSFYEVSERMSRFLRFAGYNAGIVSVMSDGASIFPSELADTSLYYDAGLLSSDAQDPLRKDCLELLFRAFNRESLALIPSLEFNAPLPMLEAKRRASDSKIDGLEWIGEDGRTWREVHHADRSTSPQYNLLNKSVQAAVLDVVREVNQRYGHHPSLAGIALELSDQAFTQLPGAEWGFDDATMARFETDTDLKVPGDGPDRFRHRAHFLLGPQQRERWTTWRADQVTAFYDRVRQELAKANPHRPLFLVTARSLDRPSVRRRVRPTLPQRSPIDQQFRELGLDWDALTQKSGIFVIRSYDPKALVGARADPVDVRVTQALELERQLSDSKQVGVQLYQRTRRFRLPSFESKSPFGQGTTFAVLATQTQPTGMAGRRAIIQALADHDAEIFVNGGTVLPTSIDPETTRLLDIYRQLPAPESLAASKVRQPVIVRTYDEGTATVVCVLNSSPWPLRVSLPLHAHAGCQMIDLAGESGPQTVPSNADGMNWEIDLAPYGMHAVRFSEENVRITDIVFEMGDGPPKRLSQAIDDLGNRAAAMRQARPYPVLMNPGFELPSPDDSISIPGWQVAKPGKGVTFGADNHDPRYPWPPGGSPSGHLSGRLSSTGPTAILKSDPFTAPATGRPTLQFYLRAETPDPQPVVRIRVQDAHDTSGFQQHRALGGGTGVPLKKDWEWYAFPIDGLPESRDAELRVWFDLLGPGTIWIDNVELRPHPKESVELLKIIFQARTHLDEQRYSDCLRILDGYWPTFLRAHVLTEAERKMQTAEEPPPAKEGGGVADRLKDLRDLVPPILRK